MLVNLRDGINRRYGSKRGLARNALATAARLLGRYRPLQRIEFERVQRIVFVCSGNICRSPLAEAVAQRAGFPAASFGLDCATDRPSNERMAQSAARIGFSLEAHRTRSPRDIQLSPGDLLVVMEPAQLPRVRPFLQEGSQLSLLGLWHDRPAPYIHDPYNSHEDYLDRCARFLMEATLCLVGRCRNARPGWRTSTRSG